MVACAGVAMQCDSEPESSPDTEFQLIADARVWVYHNYKFLSNAGAKAKIVTSLLIIPTVLAVVILLFLFYHFD
jgi:hypothetical protein